MFSGKQAENMESEVKAILSEQKDERKTLELSFLDSRQDLRRSKYYQCLLLMIWRDVCHVQIT